MSGADSVSTQFFTRFLQAFPLEHTHAVLETVITLSNELQYLDALKALISVREKECTYLASQLKNLPLLDGKGTWLTIEELTKLNLGNDASALHALLTEKHALDFPRRQRQAGDSHPLEYLCSYANLPLLDKHGTKAASWLVDYQRFQYASAQLLAASRALQDLEARCASSVSSQAALSQEYTISGGPDSKARSPQAQASTALGESNAKIPDVMELTMQQLLQAGSKLKYNSLVAKIWRNPDKLHARKHRGTWVVPVTRDNFYLFGLPAYPPIIRQETREPSQKSDPDASLAGARLSLKEIQDAGTTMSYSKLYKILKENAKIFHTFKRGRSLYGIVTQDNYTLLNLPQCPAYTLPENSASPAPASLDSKAADTSPAQPPQTGINGSPPKPLSTHDLRFAAGRKFSVEWGGRRIDFSTTTQYSPIKVREFLSKIHPDVFNEEGTAHALKLLQGESSYVSGSVLVPFLERTAGMMLADTSSTRRELAAMLGIPHTEIERALAQPPLKEFIHSYPEITSRPYLLKRELPALLTAYQRHHSSFAHGVS